MISTKSMNILNDQDRLRECAKKKKNNKIMQKENIHTSISCSKHIELCNQNSDTQTGQKEKGRRISRNEIGNYTAFLNLRVMYILFQSYEQRISFQLGVLNSFEYSFIFTT
ncbi:unnamed protein product [Ixodes pacificus]